MYEFPIVQNALDSMRAILHGVLTRTDANPVRCRCSAGHTFTITRERIDDGYFCDECEKTPKVQTSTKIETVLGNVGKVIDVIVSTGRDISLFKHLE